MHITIFTSTMRRKIKAATVIAAAVLLTDWFSIKPAVDFTVGNGGDDGASDGGEGGGGLGGDGGEGSDSGGGWGSDGGVDGLGGGGLGNSGDSGGKGDGYGLCGTGEGGGGTGDGEACANSNSASPHALVFPEPLPFTRLAHAASKASITTGSAGVSNSTPIDKAAPSSQSPKASSPRRVMLATSDASTALEAMLKLPFVRLAKKFAIESLIVSICSWSSLATYVASWPSATNSCDTFNTRIAGGAGGGALGGNGGLGGGGGACGASAGAAGGN